MTITSVRRSMVSYAVIGIGAILAIRLVGFVSHEFLPQKDVKVIQEAVAIFLYVFFLFSFRRQLERKLSASEVWASTILEFSPVMLAVHQKGKFIYVNRKGVELLGEESAEDVIGTSILKYIHPQYHDTVIQRMSFVEEHGQVAPSLSHRLVRRDGDVLEIESKAQPFKIGDEVANLVVIQDVTEQKRRDAELRSTKEQLESFIENSIDAILVLNPDLKVLRTNKAFEQMFGWSREEVLGQAPTFVRQGVAEVADLFNQAMAGQGASAHEVRCQNRFGQFFFVDFTFSPIHGDDCKVIAVAVVGRDVTARKIAAENLAQSEARYRLITENMSDLITVLDQQGVIHYASPSHEKVLGFPVESILGQSAGQYIHSEDKDRIMQGIQELARYDEALTSEFRSQTRHGWLTLEARAVPVKSPAGVLESIVVASRDITERKRIEQALLEAESRYRSLVEQASLGVFIYQHGRLAYINPRFLDIFGLSEQEALEINPIELLAEDDRHLIRQNILNESEVGARFSFQVKGMRRDHEDIFLQMYGSTILDHGIPAILGMVEDVTEHVMTQEILVKSERLGAIGQLAAGVAHEIRNPLTAIKGFLQLLRPNLSVHDDSHIRIVLDELERINQIISELLYVSKPIVGKFDVKDLHHILEDVKVLLATQAIMNNIDLVSNYDEATPQVYCDEQQLKQVFINVIKNAIEAMPDGGQICITTSACGPGKVLVSIQDQGPGIPAERLARLGEPFYTTKETGTGLGLMVSYRIIEAHHGVFDIQSQVDSGTMVTVELPVVSLD